MRTETQKFNDAKTAFSPMPPSTLSCPYTSLKI